MTLAQKINTVVYIAEQILDCYDPKIGKVATDRIICAWLRIPQLELGYRTPLQLIEEDYDRLIEYMDRVLSTARHNKL